MAIPIRPLLSCPLCGIPLHPDAHDPNRNRPPGPFRRGPPLPAPWPTVPRAWPTEARALVAHDIEDGDISLSGVGVVSLFSAIRVPRDNSLSYTETQEMHALFPSRQPYPYHTIVIPVHDACWSLLRCRLGAVVDEDEAVASVLYQLYGGGRVSGGFDIGLEYGVIPRTQEDAEMADPGRVPLLEEIEAAAGSTLTLSRVVVDDAVTETRGPFGELSMELVHAIMSYLSVPELFVLCLTCKYLLAASGSLPQTYWRARFLPGNEADFLYPDLNAPRDWRRLFFGLHRCLQDGVPSLVNRRRIRRLLEPIAALVELTAHLPETPHGLEVQVIQPENPNNPPPRPRSRRHDAVPFRAQSFHLQGALLAGLSRVVKPLRLFYSDLAGKDTFIFSYRAFSLFGNGFAIHEGRVGITMLQVGMRRYISALQYVPEKERDDGDVGARQAGFPTPDEQWMQISRDSYLERVEVAVLPEGLVGVRFLIKDQETAPWLGQCSGEGVSRGVFTVPMGVQECGLLLGFDRYKIVALGACLFTNGHEEFDSLQRHQTENKSLHIESYMWIPHPPLYKALTIGPLLSGPSGRTATEHNPPVHPLCSIDFGGPGGAFLSTLTRLVFRMEHATPFVGVECHYRDQPPRIFGNTSSTACELSFLIDGSAGERITRVDLLLGRRSMRAIQISTNHGRSAPFGTIENISAGDTLNLPDIPDGEVITGFVVSRRDIRTPSGYAALGLQTQKAHQVDAPDAAPAPASIQYRPVPVPPAEVARRTSHLAQRHNNSAGSRDYTFHTSAPLTAVRRVTASIGMLGRSRSESDISGLMVEYYDDTPSVIVGQWFATQPHTAVDFEPGEGVRSVEVVMRTGDEPVTGGYLSCSMVTVAGIRIETSCSRTVIFVAPGIDLDTFEEGSLRSVHWKTADAEHGDEDTTILTTLAWEVSREKDSLHTTCCSCRVDGLGPRGDCGIRRLKAARSTGDHM
ncbi:hypothetical protein BJY00DRAFT_289777 [Aspergillus carlsbadensis]|nr:hypothetical protein BJY00DRAFT_289777 [Aspergillus carlsbadensis]